MTPDELQRILREEDYRKTSGTSSLMYFIALLIVAAISLFVYGDL